MNLKHYSMIHFKPQLFNGIGGGGGSVLPGYVYIREIKTLGLGLSLGIVVYKYVLRASP